MRMNLSDFFPSWRDNPLPRDVKVEKIIGEGVSAGGIMHFPDLPILFKAGPNNRAMVVVFVVASANDVTSLKGCSPL